MKKHPFFVAFDGEGIDGRYVLLSDSHGGELFTKEGLGTRAVFEHFYRRRDELETETDKPVFVGFGLTYDCNMILRDIPDDLLAEIMQREDKDFVTWEEWSILYFPRKLLRIRHAEMGQLTIFDVFTFFGTSFVQACENFLPGVNLRQIEAGKKARGVFRFKDLEKIRRYNVRECQLLVMLCDRMKALLDSQDIHLNKWHGPGAVADYILGAKGYNVHEDYVSDGNYSPPQSYAFDCAYYGGRIENFVIGTVRDVISYDINSAYPYAASKLPIVHDVCAWKHTKGRGTLQPFSVCRVRWNLTSKRGSSSPAYVGPFPWRHHTGRIFFPIAGEGWYWLPEVQAARALYGRKIEVLEAWEQRDFTLSRLSWVVPKLYSKRQQLKAKGDAGEYAIKIALNSLYGKLAQRTGRAPYLCIPWAGFITSYTRAMLLRAIASDPRNVLAFATDSVFVRKALPSLNLSSKIGDWKPDTYKKFLCIMSGFYRLDSETKKSKFATRGLPREAVDEDMIAQLNATGKVTFKQRVFVTHNLAMHFPEKWKGKRLLFQDDLKTLDPFHAGKREYLKDHLDDWENDYSDSRPVVKQGLSAPSGLVVQEEENKTDRNREFSEVESETAGEE